MVSNKSRQNILKLAAVLFLLVSLVISGCSSSVVRSYNNDEISEGIMSESVGNSFNSVDSSTSVSGEQHESSDENTNAEISLNQDKLVYTARMVIETTDFESEVNEIKELILNYNGIIQSENYSDYTSYSYYVNSIDGKMVTIEARIPSEKYGDFSNGIEEIGHIKSFKYNIENITTTYYNKQAYLESYNLQLEELKRLYSKASTVSELIEVEERISEVQYQIDRLTTEIKRMDLDINYSTLTITVNEVNEYTLTELEKESQPFFVRLWENIKNSAVSFARTSEGMLVSLIYMIWYIAVIVIIVVVIRKIKARKRKSEISEFIKCHEGFEDFVKMNGLDTYKAMKKYKNSINYTEEKSESVMADKDENNGNKGNGIDI